METASRTAARRVKARTARFRNLDCPTCARLPSVGTWPHASVAIVLCRVGYCSSWPLSGENKKDPLVLHERQGARAEVPHHVSGNSPSRTRVYTLAGLLLLGAYHHQTPLLLPPPPPPSPPPPPPPRCHHVRPTPPHLTLSHSTPPTRRRVGLGPPTEKETLRKRRYERRRHGSPGE